MKRLAVFLACAMALTSVAADTADWSYKLPEKIIMPGGEVYTHPVVTNVAPDGITIMHDCGAAFWPFSQLPEDIRNKFHYNVADAVKYHDQMILRRKHMLEQRAQEQVKDERLQAYTEMVSQRYYCLSLKTRIDQLERRIKWDKENEQRSSNEMQNDRTNIEGVATSGNNNQTSGLFWNSVGGNDNAEKIKIAGNFESDWKQNETDYKMWRFAEHSGTDTLEELKQDYADAQAKLKVLENRWTEIRKNATPEEDAKLNKQIHDDVNKLVDDSMRELETLRKMLNDKLITPDEYIRKKGEILKRM